jgi:hypothetical protein
LFAPPIAPPLLPFASPPPMPFPGYPQAQGVPFGFDPNQAAMPSGFPAPAGFAPTPAFVPAPAAPMSEETSSVATKYKRKLNRRNRSGVWVALVAFVVIDVGAAIYFLRLGAKPDLLSGKLTGTRIAKGKLEPALVHREWIAGIDDETLDNVLKQMEKRTVKFRSGNDLISMVLQGSPEGIKVLATAGPSAELIAVYLTSHKELDKWHQKHAAKLSDQCQKKVASSARKFVQEWTRAEAARDTNHSFGHFHDDLGLATLTMGLGAEVVAIVGNTAHGCVAEQQGMLYFLLPSGTNRFELQGREHGKDNVIFPGHFVVNVEATPRIKKPAQKKTDDESEMAEDNEADMKPKAFGKPAINDPSAMDESMPEKPKKKGKPGNGEPKTENEK